jgi:hypothetical protein
VREIDVLPEDGLELVGGGMAVEERRERRGERKKEEVAGSRSFVRSFV